MLGSGHWTGLGGTSSASEGESESEVARGLWLGRNVSSNSPRPAGAAAGCALEAARAKGATTRAAPVPLFFGPPLTRNLSLDWRKDPKISLWPKSFLRKDSWSTPELLSSRKSVAWSSSLAWSSSVLAWLRLGTHPQKEGREAAAAAAALASKPVASACAQTGMCTTAEARWSLIPDSWVQG